MASEMVERVARAIDRAQSDWAMGRFHALSRGSLALQRAHYVLDELRAPTDAMRRVGRGAGWHGNIQGEVEAEEEAAAGLWRAMIDAAIGA